MSFRPGKDALSFRLDSGGMRTVEIVIGWCISEFGMPANAKNFGHPPQWRYSKGARGDSDWLDLRIYFNDPGWARRFAERWCESTEQGSG